MKDDTEDLRRAMIATGQVDSDLKRAVERWTTDELERDFDVIGFLPLRYRQGARVTARRAAWSSNTARAGTSTSWRTQNDEPYRHRLHHHC